MLVSQSRKVALDIITVRGTQPYLQSHPELEYLEREEDATVELAHAIITGEVPWVCRLMDQTLYKLVAIFNTEEMLYLAVLLGLEVI